MGVEWSGQADAHDPLWTGQWNARGARENADRSPAPGTGRERLRAWSEAVPRFRDAWEKIKVTYRYTERGRSVAQPADCSWRGAGGRKLDRVGAQHQRHLPCQCESFGDKGQSSG